MKHDKRIGLVLGKFMPIHAGHMALINFAVNQCDEVYVLVGATPREPIPGPLRFSWVQQVYVAFPKVHVVYTDAEFPEDNEPNRTVSEAWANFLKVNYPMVTHLFTSEGYGDYVAEYMGIEHVSFDPGRHQKPISATMIRSNPFKYWEHIPRPVRHYYTRKICLVGPESTGKSTMTKMLAKYFDTSYIHEVARDMMDTSYTCTYEDMARIAKAQAHGARNRVGTANKVIFCDSDLLTTKVYSKYLFGKVPRFPKWVQEVNKYDLYLFMEADVPYVQDGTRLGAHTRPELRELFFKAVVKSKVPYAVITGADWKHRFKAAVQAVEIKFPELQLAPLLRHR